MSATHIPSSDVNDGQTPKKHHQPQSQQQHPVELLPLPLPMSAEIRHSCGTGTNASPVQSDDIGEEEEEEEEDDTEEEETEQDTKMSVIRYTQEQILQQQMLLQMENRMRMEMVQQQQLQQHPHHSHNHSSHNHTCTSCHVPSVTSSVGVNDELAERLAREEKIAQQRKGLTSYEDEDEEGDEDDGDEEEAAASFQRDFWRLNSDDPDTSTNVSELSPLCQNVLCDVPHVELQKEWDIFHRQLGKDLFHYTQSISFMIKRCFFRKAWRYAHPFPVATFIYGGNMHACIRHVLTHGEWNKKHKLQEDIELTHQVSLFLQVIHTTWIEDINMQCETGCIRSLVISLSYLFS